MKVNQWIALIDVFDLFQLKRYCTTEELDGIQKILELDIMTHLIELRSPDLPSEEDTLDAIAKVKKDFIIEYLREAEEESEEMEGIAAKVEKLLTSHESTPEELEQALNVFYKVESKYE